MRTVRNPESLRAGQDPVTMPVAGLAEADGDPELTIEGGAAGLEQAIGTAARPTHLLRLFRNGKCRLSLINDDGT